MGFRDCDARIVISHLELVLRIAVGAVLGGVIGYERDRHRRPVGLRTHLIVAMASATFMVVSTQFLYSQHYDKEDLVAIDTSRIASAVVSAVGFLAGGAIVRTGATVQGLTTAAALWLVTAIGMCAGAGMYTEGVAATAMGLIALTMLRRLEGRNDHLRRRVSVTLGDDAADIASVTDALRAIGATMDEVEYERRFDGDKKRVVVTFNIECPNGVAVPKVIGVVEGVRGVRRVVVQHQG